MCTVLLLCGKYVKTEDTNRSQFCEMYNIHEWYGIRKW
jgi:hypothetical protein